MPRRLVPLLALAALAGTAGANPLTLARFGGLAGDPVYQGAFALYWNPAALAQADWQVNVETQMIARQASYDRDAALNHVPDALQAANSGRATTGAFGVVPGIAFRHGHRLGGFDLGGGVGVFIENGGAANWDKNLAAPTQFPGAIDGPQRWAAISAKLTILELGLGVGVRHRASGLSFGVTPILALASFQTVRARNINQSEDLVDSQGNPKEGRAYFEGTDNTFSAVFGARWDAAPGWSVGATYQRGARFHLDGKLKVAFGTQAPSNEPSTAEVPVADTVRLGGSLRLTHRLTLRPMVEWSMWSILDQHVFRSDSDGTPLFVIERQFHDGLAARVRADFAAPRGWRLTGDLGGELGPTPEKTMEPGFGEGNSVEAGVGAAHALSPFVDLSASFIFHQFLDRTITDSILKPTANGTYRDQREYFLVDVEIHGCRN